MKYIISTIVFVIVATSSISGNRAFAADVYNDSIGVYLWGPIEKGDYQKVADALVYRSFFGQTKLILHSKGGSVSEALKIAELVNDLWITVDVSRFPKITGFEKVHEYTERELFLGQVIENGGEVYKRKTKIENAVCYSACALILLASPRPHYLPRTVDGTLGFHRPYLQQEYNRELKPSDSKLLYIELAKKYSAALKEYGLSESYVSEVMATPSSKIDLVSYDEWIEHFQGRHPWYEEYFIAQCGTLSEGEEQILDDYYEDVTEAHLAGVTLLMTRERELVVDEISNKEREIKTCENKQRTAHFIKNVRNYSDVWELVVSDEFKDMTAEEFYNGPLK